jgi:CHAT domain-containing protein/Flp pilus assembly protein TadD
MKSFYILLILFCAKLNLSAQDEEFKKLKNNFDRFRNEEKNDSVLITAKQMNVWALKNNGDTSVAYISSFISIGAAFSSLNQIDSALFYFKVSLMKFKNENLIQHSRYVDCLNNLDLTYRLMGDYKSAELYCKEALEIRRKLLGEFHLLYSSSLSNLGSLYTEMGEYELAMLNIQQSLRIIEKKYGLKHLEYAKGLRRLYTLCWKKGDFMSAEAYIKESLEIIKKELGDQHPEYAKSLNNLGVLYKEKGNYKSAEKYYILSLEIVKKELGTQHPDYAKSLNNLGVLYKGIGDYKSAVKYLKESLEIRKKALGTQHPDYAKSLNNLGVLYKGIGDYKSAELYIKESLEIRKKALGDQHPDYANSLNNLGVLYNEMGNYKSAEANIKESLEIVKKALGTQHPDYAKSLNNLGVLYKGIGDYKSAELYIKESLEIIKKALGVQHPDYANSLNNLGNLYKDMSIYKASEVYIKESLEIRKKTLGDKHPDYVKSLSNLASLYSISNRVSEALFYYETSFNNLNKNICLDFEWLNEKEKELYWKRNSMLYNDIDHFSSVNKNDFPRLTCLSYNGNLFTKSKLLEDKISKENDLAEIVELREKLSFLRKKLAKLIEDDEGSNYKKLEDEANLIDSKLTLMWDEYATQKKNLSITWDQVQANLAGDEAAIEFVRYKSDKDSQYYYNALIVRKTDVYPILVPLCSENQLKGILKKGFSAYYPLVWAPMDGYLKEIKTIYYSPVGLLNTIPFAALYPQKNGGDEVTFDKKTKKIVSKTESDANYLMNRYTLHQLSSTRYLAMGLKENSTNKIDKSIALIGGVNYDFIPGESKKTIKKEMQLASREANISKPLEYLQGTKIEVETIGKSMQKNGWSTSLLENDSATEDNLIKFENQAAKGILHIATHGFAFPNIKELPPNSDSSISNNNFCYYTNPLQRCGLILAGANWTWMGRDDLKNKNPEAEDGILTAAQVALLNLRKTKLVVLSACETGLGKIEGSEGVIGLTRAFKLAGVEQLIVSLWEVPDKETMELMTIFYEDLSRTQNAIISFEKAQKIMSLKYPTRPDMWAGFVLIR